MHNLSPHDAERAIQAATCDRKNLESLTNAIRGLQSTDDPRLNQLHDELTSCYQLLLKNELKHDEIIKLAQEWLDSPENQWLKPDWKSRYNFIVKHLLDMLNDKTNV